MGNLHKRFRNIESGELGETPEDEESLEHQQGPAGSAPQMYDSI